jgi:uncharacterized membrane protein
MNKTRWLILLLVVSVGVNLLGVGLIAGRLMSDRPERPIPPMSLGWILRALDEDSRKQLRPQFEAHTREVRPLLRKMRQAQRDFNDQLLMEQPDSAAMQSSLQQLRRSSDEYQTEMHAMMVEIIARLDADQRARIVSILRNPRKARGRAPGGPGPGGLRDGSGPVGRDWQNDRERRD